MKLLQQYKTILWTISQFSFQTRRSKYWFGYMLKDFNNWVKSYWTTVITWDVVRVLTKLDPFLELLAFSPTSYPPYYWLSPLSRAYRIITHHSLHNYWGRRNDSHTTTLSCQSHNKHTSQRPKLLPPPSMIVTLCIGWSLCIHLPNTFIKTMGSRPFYPEDSYRIF